MLLNRDLYEQIERMLKTAIGSFRLFINLDLNIQAQAIMIMIKRYYGTLGHCFLNVCKLIVTVFATSATPYR